MDEQVYAILVEVLESLTSGDKVSQEQFLDVVATIRTLLKVYSEPGTDGSLPAARKPGLLKKLGLN